MECWKRNHGIIMMEERRKKLRLLSRVEMMKREEQQRVVKSEDDAKVEVGENEIKTDKEEQQPATKRQRLATAQDVSKAIITSPKSVISNEVKQQQQQQPLSSSIQNKEGVLDQQEEEEEELMPELERPVPGMHGLSVEFVRDAFYNTNSDTNKNEEEGMVKKEEEITTEGQRREEYSFENDGVLEEIYSDRLASGRYVRLSLITGLHNQFICMQNRIHNAFSMNGVLMLSLSIPNK